MDGRDPVDLLLVTLCGIKEEVAALRQQLAQVRQETQFDGALLRQDVANKLLELRHSVASRHELVQLVRKLHRQVLCLRSDSQQEHRQLLAACGLPAPIDSWPSARDWAEVRAHDSAPRPAERPASGGSSVDPCAQSAGDEEPGHTLSLEHQPCQRPATPGDGER